MNCQAAQKLIESYFVQRREREREQVREHLAQCAACQDLYQRLFVAEGALGGGAQSLSLSPPEKDALLARALPATLPERIGRRGLMWAVAATAAASTLVALWPKSPSREEDAPQPRGAAVSLATVSARLLCLSTPAGGPVLHSVAADDPAASCPRGGALGFTVRNASGSPLFLVVAAAGTGERPHQVFPESGTHRVETTADESPLDFALPLAAMPAGADIWACFSTDPTDERTMLAPVDDGDPAGEHMRLFHWRISVQEPVP